MPISSTGPNPTHVLAIAIACLTAGCMDWVTENAPDVSYSAVTTGSQYACGLTLDGEVYCWRADLPRPERVSDGLRFQSVSTFLTHTCALDEAGVAYCWGLNTFGQLGTVETRDRCLVSGNGATAPCARAPIAVETSLRFLSIETGGDHTCGIVDTGEAYCWGLNISGQLGTTAALTCDLQQALEDFPCTPTPVVVEGPALTALSAGNSHTCGIGDDGRGYCWGSGGSGRLGIGTSDNAATPTLIAGDLTYQQISAGGSHTCAITDDGTAYCWGSNADLQVGNKETERACGYQLTRCFTTPQRLAGDRRYIAISASDAPLSAGSPLGGHSCALTASGRVFCWGLNESGQLGGGPQLRSADPVQLDIEENLSSISAGRFNTCGVTDGGSVICWSFGSPLETWKVPVT